MARKKNLQLPLWYVITAVLFPGEREYATMCGDQSEAVEASQMWSVSDTEGWK